MKKSTIAAIANVLSSIDFEDKAVIMDEINREINKDAEKKAEKAAEYENAREIVLATIADAPHTVAEIAEMVADSLPDFTRGKIQYALLHMWNEDVVVISGKPNSYRRA